MVTGDDDGGGRGGSGGIEVPNGVQEKHTPRNSGGEAHVFRLDKIREVDLLNQSGSQEGSIAGTKDEVIR